jgi:hypothetical protein
LEAGGFQFVVVHILEQFFDALLPSHGVGINHGSGNGPVYQSRNDNLYRMSNQDAGVFRDRL